MLQMGMSLVAIAGTIIMVTYHPSLVTATHLNGYQSISSPGTQSSNQLQWLDWKHQLGSLNNVHQDNMPHFVISKCQNLQQHNLVQYHMRT